MISNDREYQEEKRQLAENDAFIAQQLIELRKMGLSESEIRRAMQPLYSFRQQWREEIEEYESAVR